MTKTFLPKHSKTVLVVLGIICTFAGVAYGAKSIFGETPVYAYYTRYPEGCTVIEDGKESPCPNTVTQGYMIEISEQEAIARKLPYVIPGPIKRKSLTALSIKVSATRQAELRKQGVVIPTPNPDRVVVVNGKVNSNGEYVILRGHGEFMTMYELDAIKHGFTKYVVITEEKDMVDAVEELKQQLGYID